MKNKYYALWLSLICIVIFIIQVFIPGFTDLFLLDASKPFDIWRFLSSIFLHADLGHLAYNLFALALFGTILESFIGSRRFLFIFFITGIFANLISVNFYSSSLGASGAIFGVIGALILVRPMLIIWAFGMPMPIVLAGILWAIGDLIGAYGFFVGNPMGNTGNIAHLSGMFLGLILGYYFRLIVRKEERRKSNRLTLNENNIRSWENYYLKD